MPIRLNAEMNPRQFRRVVNRINNMPIEINRELKRIAIEKAGAVIVRKAQQVNYGFRDRTGLLRRSIRLGRPKSSKFGVQIPIIAGVKYTRKSRNRPHYAGFVELGTKRMYPRQFLRRALLASGVQALSALQREMVNVLRRYSNRGRV